MLAYHMIELFWILKSNVQKKSISSTELCSVIYSSPFQAQFVSQTRARQHEDELPLAAETVSNSALCGWQYGLDAGRKSRYLMYKQLHELWAGGIHALKWLSNSPKVLEKIPIEDRASEVDISENPNNSDGTENHVASRRRHVYIQSRSARRTFLAH